jgi:hypothetical protein
MDKRKWTVADMNRAMGLPRGHVGVYKWLASKGAPAETNARKLGKVFNIPWEQFLAGASAPRQALVPSPPPRKAEVLSFNVADDGQARLRLDITLPVTEAMPLLRMILDAGKVLGDHTNG